MGSLFCFCFTQFCHKMALPVSILTNRMRHWDAGYILYTIHLYTLHIKLIFTELGIGEVITRKVTMKVTRNLAVIRVGWCGISLPCMLAPMHAGAHMLNRSAILGFLYNKKLLWQRSKNGGNGQKITENGRRYTREYLSNIKYPTILKKFDGGNGPKQADLWPKWIRHFERYRVTSGLSNKGGCRLFPF